MPSSTRRGVPARAADGTRALRGDPGPGVLLGHPDLALMAARPRQRTSYHS
jgi:hypothetical protein